MLLTQSDVHDVFCGGRHTLCLASGLDRVTAVLEKCSKKSRTDKESLHNFPFHDCVLIVSGQAIFCHKAIIGQRCEVIEKMINEEIISGRDFGIIELLFANLHYDVALCLVQYLYTGNVSHSFPDILSIVEEVANAAQYFQLEELLCICDIILGKISDIGIFKQSSLDFHVGNLLKDNKWTDLQIITTDCDKVINVHRFVLASRSNFFRTLIEKMSSTDCVLIELPDSFRSACRVIDFIYTGNLSDISEQALTEDLANAHKYKLDDLKFH